MKNKNNNCAEIRNPIRELDALILYKNKENEFLVEHPSGKIIEFKEKSKAEQFMLLEFYKNIDLKNRKQKKH